MQIKQIFLRYFVLSLVRFTMFIVCFVCLFVCFICLFVFYTPPTAKVIK